MKELLNNYFDLQKKIYDYFGYIEQWRDIPIADDTHYFWKLNENEVDFCEADNIQEAIEIFKTEEGKLYSNEFYTHAHLEKCVYRAKDYTMIVVDTRTDGNFFLQIFDNAKEIKC